MKKIELGRCLVTDRPAMLFRDVDYRRPITSMPDHVVIVKKAAERLKKATNEKGSVRKLIFGKEGGGGMGLRAESLRN